MNMSLRMEQWTPPEWQSVIDLVADRSILKKMAGYRKRISAQYMREELFVYLADNWVVQAELNLELAKSVDRARLTVLLDAEGIDFKEGADGSLSVGLNELPIRLKVEEKGQTRISTQGPLHNAVCLSLKEESIVLLLQFLEEAMFVLEARVEDIVLEEEREEMITCIYGQALRVKLDELGESYTMEADEKFITIQVNLKPDRRLRFCVRAEKAQEMAEKIEGLIAAANTLNREYWDTGIRIE